MPKPTTPAPPMPLSALGLIGGADLVLALKEAADALRDLAKSDRPVSDDRDSTYLLEGADFVDSVRVAIPDILKLANGPAWDVGRLRAALVSYGQHRKECATSLCAGCTCGYAEALDYMPPSGGIGTEQAEMHGLRVACLELESQLATTESENARLREALAESTAVVGRLSPCAGDGCDVEEDPGTGECVHARHGNALMAMSLDAERWRAVAPGLRTWYAGDSTHVEGWFPGYGHGLSISAFVDRFLLRRRAAVRLPASPPENENG